MDSASASETAHWGSVKPRLDNLYAQFAHSFPVLNVENKPAIFFVLAMGEALSRISGIQATGGGSIRSGGSA